MYRSIILAGFISIFVPHKLFAQKEYSIWYLGNGNGIDFNYDQPQIINNAPLYDPTLSTISDFEGHLLLYTNGETVWNSENEIIENGDSLNGILLSNMIIRAPESDSLFYIFHLGIRTDIKYYDDRDRTLFYSIADISKDGGKGKIIKKNKKLISGLHGGVTVAGNCEQNKFWIIGGANPNASVVGDKIYAFRINKYGIDSIPVISTLGIGYSVNYCASPTGEKIVFSGEYKFAESQYGNAILIADFNQKTGIVSVPINIEPEYGFGAFSANGNFLYVSYTPSFYFNWNARIFQYDLLHNYDKILLAEDSAFFGLPQLAPNGKIYLITDSINMGVINNPDIAGMGCNFINDRLFDFKSYMDKWVDLPRVPTYLFVNDPLNANAGSNKEICANYSVQLGGESHAPQQYIWEPVLFLNNPNISNPVFRYPGNPDSTLEFTYKLTVLNGTCKNKAEVKVIVHPNPEAPISGSKSVCPGVEFVDYWSNEGNLYAYEWNVDGGNLMQGQGTDSIKINWGPTNPKAWVGLQITNQFNCISNQTRFNVRINVELDTETPRGLQNVCSNLSDSNLYQITRTNRSVYTWGIEGGSILQGQSSNKVNVNWGDENGYHFIWVQETSTTIDTVCYGASDTVQVKLFKDSLQAQINFVSIDPGDETKGFLSGELINNPANINFPVDVLRNENVDTSWGIIESVKSDSNKIFFRDQNLDTDHSIYEYRLQMVNGCMEDIMSDIHNTIRLQGTNDEKQNTIQLNWNPYGQWPEGVDHYELYRKLDKDTVFSLFKTLVSGQLSNESNDGLAGFDHRFLIKAVSRDPEFYSWSNQIELDFKHPLFIPNVITPNGDGFNDTFEIIPIELYQDNYLIITDRWGKKIFEQKNYKGGWIPANQDSGVYYYELYVIRISKEFKGWLQVLR